MRDVQRGYCGRCGVATAPTDRELRHLHRLTAQRPADVADPVVMPTGRHAYRRPDGIAVVPAALLGP